MSVASNLQVPSLKIYTSFLALINPFSSLSGTLFGFDNPFTPFSSSTFICKSFFIESIISTIFIGLLSNVEVFLSQCISLLTGFLQTMHIFSIFASPPHFSHFFWKLMALQFEHLNLPSSKLIVLSIPLLFSVLYIFVMLLF